MSLGMLYQWLPLRCVTLLLCIMECQCECSEALWNITVNSWSNSTILWMPSGIVCPMYARVWVWVDLCMCGAVSNQIRMQIIVMIIILQLFVSVFIYNTARQRGYWTELCPLWSPVHRHVWWNYCVGFMDKGNGCLGRCHPWYITICRYLTCHQKLIVF